MLKENLNNYYYFYSDKQKKTGKSYSFFLGFKPSSHRHHLHHRHHHQHQSIAISLDQTIQFFLNNKKQCRTKNSKTKKIKDHITASNIIVIVL